MIIYLSYRKTKQTVIYFYIYICGYVSGYDCYYVKRIAKLDRVTGSHAIESYQVTVK